MGRRYDYRRQYMGLSKKELEDSLEYLKGKLTLNIGICDSNTEDYLKRVVYVESRLDKLKG